MLLGVVVVLWRGALLLEPNGATRLSLPIHFVVLAATPFMLFSSTGRARMGLTTGIGVSALLRSVAGGALAAVAIGALGTWLFAGSPDNWYVTVAERMLRDARLGDLPDTSLFLALAVPAAIFSPIGEEFFFRGVLQETMAERVGAIRAAVITATVFGVMHIVHHGLAVEPDGLELRTVSGALWVLLTIGLGLLFTALRSYSGSIWSAVVCHATFNIVMVAWIVIVIR